MNESMRSEFKCEGTAAGNVDKSFSRVSNIKRKNRRKKARPEVVHYREIFYRI